MSATWQRRLSLLQLAAGIGMVIAAGWGGLILLGLLSRRHLPLLFQVFLLGIGVAIVANVGRRALRSRS